MARVELAEDVGADLDRIIEHLLQHEVQDATSRIEGIIEAISILQSNPCIGRLTRTGLRELVIGQGEKGYVALYRYVQEMDTAFVLALKNQREAGYRELS